MFPLLEQPQYQVLLNSIDKVKLFNRKVSSLDYNIDIIVGSMVFDGKSLMALFGLDLTRPIGIFVHDENKLASFRDIIKEFLYE